MQEFTEQVIDILLQVPAGSVVTYGQVAAMAGSPRGARQVVRILSSMSQKYNLPWHRVINAHGKIAIRGEDGAERQRERLISEGVVVKENYKIDLKKYQWVGN